MAAKSTTQTATETSEAQMTTKEPSNTAETQEARARRLEARRKLNYRAWLVQREKNREWLRRNPPAWMSLKAIAKKHAERDASQREVPRVKTQPGATTA